MTSQLQENTVVDDDVGPVVAEAMKQCDVACLLYDSSHPGSFSVASAMLVCSCQLSLSLSLYSSNAPHTCRMPLTRVYLIWFHVCS